MRITWCFRRLALLNVLLASAGVAGVAGVALAEAALALAVAAAQAAVVVTLARRVVAHLMVQNGGFASWSRFTQKKTLSSEI